ncbi:MAG TPA: LptA/OstA family protein [Verrucomicrobiae bacterium]|nr:LptA/OstA family protein [Verrucomicrobiae bacterium]
MTFRPVHTFVTAKRVFSAVAFLLAVSLSAQNKSSTPAGKVTGGFNVPYFENNVLKGQFEGDTAKPMPGGLIQVGKFRLNTFTPARVVDLAAKAEECFFDRASIVAFSPSRLQVQRPDGRFFLEGDGFEWRQKDTHLYVSNRVHTVLRIDSTNAPSAGAANPPQVLEVHADFFEFNYASSLAVYTGHVRVVEEGRLRLNCDRLTAKLPSGEVRTFQSIVAEQRVDLTATENGVDYHATGDRAIYTSVAGVETVVITGNTGWQMRQYEGTGDILTLVSQGKNNFSFHVETNAFVKFPAALLNHTNSAGASPAPVTTTNQFVEINADDYLFQGGVVEFRGNVRANSQAGWKLSAALVTVRTQANSNRVENIQAERDVIVDFQQGGKTGRATGDRAVYDAVTSDVTMTGNAMWRSQNYSGSGDELVVNTREKEMDYAVRGNAILRLPGSTVGQFRGFLPGATATTNRPPPGTNQFLEIRSGQYRLRDRVATFTDHVRAINPPAQLTCAKLVTYLMRDADRLERIEAEGSVVLNQEDSRVSAERMTAKFSSQTNRVEQLTAEKSVSLVRGSGAERVTARGDSADYSATDGIMHLRGDPTLETGQGIVFKGEEEVIWDVVRQKFRANRFNVRGTGASLRKATNSPPANAIAKP